MALEQTINAKTKNRLKGITAYVYVASAVNRWVVVNSMRSQLVNPLLKLVDLKSMQLMAIKNYNKAKRKKTNVIWMISNKLFYMQMDGAPVLR